MNQNDFAYCKDGKVWQKSFLEFPDRAVGDILENNEELSIQHYTTNFEQVIQKLNVLENEFNTNANKGSYLIKIQFLKEHFLTFPAVGDYNSVYEKLNLFEKEINEIVASNRERNLSIKKALIDEVKFVINDPDWKTVTDKLKEIRAKWIKTGSVIKELEESVNEEFRLLVDGFFDKKKSFFEDKQKMFESRIEAYKEILNKAKNIPETKPSASYDFKKLQEEWKNVGVIPKDKVDSLLKEFNLYKKKFAIKKPFQADKQKVNINPELSKNYEIKQKMVEKAKTLAFSPTTPNTHKEIEALKAEWKTIGPVDKKVSGAQWENFINFCDRGSELAYLEHLVTKKLGKIFTDENQKTKKKAELLRESIQNDKNEIRLYEDNQAMFSGKTLDKLIDNKIANRKRKLLAKELLLQEMLESIK